MFSEALTEALRASLTKDSGNNQKLILCGSGTAALHQIFRALRARTRRSFVAMAAYTCPDIACAAVRAGFKVYPVDIDEKTLEMKASLAPGLPFGDIAVIVMSNLYGLPDALEAWKGICSDNGCLIVDDACQAAWSSMTEGQAGCRTEIGVFSFGRGKAFCGVGGGAVFADILQSQVLKQLAGPEFSPDSGLQNPVLKIGPIASLKDLALNLLAWVFENPRLYPFPARILGTRLGETKCKLDFSISAPSAAALLAALGNMLVKDQIRRAYVANARLFHDGVGQRQLDVLEPFVERNFSFSSGVVPIRYPILVNNSDRQTRLLREFRRLGLGVSGSYPKTLLDFEELRPHVEQLSCEGSRAVASRILTIPIHRHVTDNHREMILETLASIVSRQEQ